MVAVCALALTTSCGDFLNEEKAKYSIHTFRLRMALRLHLQVHIAD